MPAELAVTLPGTDDGLPPSDPFQAIPLPRARAIPTTTGLIASQLHVRERHERELGDPIASPVENCNRTFTDNTGKRTATLLSCIRTATGVALKINSPRDLGAAVRGRRISLGFSQAEVARQAGVSRPWLSNVEAGKPSAEFGRILRLLDALRLSVQLEVSPEIARTVDLDALLLEYEDR